MFILFINKYMIEMLIMNVVVIELYIGDGRIVDIMKIREFYG